MEEVAQVGCLPSVGFRLFLSGLEAFSGETVFLWFFEEVRGLGGLTLGLGDREALGQCPRFFCFGSVRRFGGFGGLPLA